MSGPGRVDLKLLYPGLFKRTETSSTLSGPGEAPTAFGVVLGLEFFFPWLSLVKHNELFLRCEKLGAWEGAGLAGAKQGPRRSNLVGKARVGFSALWIILRNGKEPPSHHAPAREGLPTLHMPPRV